MHEFYFETSPIDVVDHEDTSKWLICYKSNLSSRKFNPNINFLTNCQPTSDNLQTKH